MRVEPQRASKARRPHQTEKCPARHAGRSGARTQPKGIAVKTKRINIITGAPLAPWQVERLDALREVRRDARKPARSGNPAKSGPARKILLAVPHAVRLTLWGHR